MVASPRYNFITYTIIQLYTTYTTLLIQLYYSYKFEGRDINSNEYNLLAYNDSIGVHRCGIPYKTCLTQKFDIG